MSSHNHELPKVDIRSILNLSIQKKINSLSPSKYKLKVKLINELKDENEDFRDYLNNENNSETTINYIKFQLCKKKESLENGSISTNED